MGISVSESFRQNCYDLSKKQRLVLRSGNMTLSNEDISVNGGVKFNLASITSTQQVQFGCTPCNTISVSILNEDGRITSDSIVGNEFYCDIGVESGTGTYEAPLTAISAVSTGDEYISVHAEAPYVRGNCTFGSLHPQLMYGYKCKIMYVYDILYFVIKNGTETYYAKHTKTGSHSYSVYTTPSDTECSILDKLMNEAPYDAICYYAGGIVEYTYDHEEGIVEGEWATASGSIVYITDALAHSMASWVVGLGQAPGEPYVPTSDFTSWSVLKTGTWGNAKNNTWGSYSGYSVFNTVIYESVPYGVWHFDRPRRVNSAVLTISGKDRMALFDEDSAQFVASLTDKSDFTPFQLVNAIAAFKGVPFVHPERFNERGIGHFFPFSYLQNKSLKDILSYAFEVAGSNCLIDREGNLCPSSIEDDPVDIPYFYSFDVADYTAHTIGRVLIAKMGELFKYQSDDSVINGVDYDWSDNPYFFSNYWNHDLDNWFNNHENWKYGNFRNAVTVTDADYSLWCDDVYRVTDPNNREHVETCTFDVDFTQSGSGDPTVDNPRPIVGTSSVTLAQSSGSGDPVSETWDFGTTIYKATIDATKNEVPIEYKSVTLTADNYDEHGFSYYYDASCVGIMTRLYDAKADGTFYCNIAKQSDSAYVVGDACLIEWEPEYEEAYDREVVIQIGLPPEYFPDGETVLEDLPAFLAEHPIQIVYEVEGTVKTSINKPTIFENTTSVTVDGNACTVTRSTNVVYREPIFSMSLEWNGTGRVTYSNYGDESRTYSSYSSRVEGTTNAIDQSLSGLTSAQNSNAISFNEDGMTAQSGGVRVLNNSGEEVLAADDEGNLKVKGNVQADSGYVGRFNIGEDGIQCGGEENNVYLGYENGVPVIESTNTSGSTRINGQDVSIKGIGTTATSANAVLVSTGTDTWRRFYVSTSLRKMKANIKPIENASEKVDNLSGVSFTSKCEADDPNVVLYGFIAEEVEKAVPELASYMDGKLQGVQYDRVCALLVEDNKACHKRIADLEQRIEELERRLK